MRVHTHGKDHKGRNAFFNFMDSIYSRIYINVYGKCTCLLPIEKNDAIVPEYGDIESELNCQLSVLVV